MFFLIGLAIFLFSLAFSVIIIGGDVMNFIDIPSLLFILGPIVAVLTATQSFKIFYAGVRAVIFPKEKLSEKMRRRAVSLFRLLSKTAVMSAAIATLICFVNMLMNLDFSHAGGVASLGVNISASLVSIIYGLLLTVAVFEPMAFILKKRRGIEHGSQIYTGQSVCRNCGNKA